MNSIRQSLFFIIFFGLSLTNLSAQQVVNLTTNPGFNVDMNGWEFEPTALGIEPVILEGGGLDGTSALHSGYVIEASQTFDLLELGYTASYLDSSPIIRFAYYVKGSGPQLDDQTSYTIKTIDADGTILKFFNSDWILTTGDWQQINYNLVNYGKNVRSIEIEIVCWDKEENQSGIEGVILDAVNLSVGNHLMYTNNSTKDHAGWDEVVNGGDGWDLSNHWVKSSFEWSSRSQTIDLLELGYSEAALDSEPRIDLWEFILGTDGPLNGTGFADNYRLIAELRDATGNVIVDFDSETVFCTDQWQGVTTNFQNYGPGLREIYVQHFSKDVENWAGHYGGYTDAMQLTMDFCQGFDITPTIVNESFDGNDDGSIDLAVSGGVADYVYSWNNGATTAAISDLPDGTYDVTIVDDYGCEETNSYTVEAGDFNTSTNKVNQLNYFNISPNPTTDIVNITFDLDQQMEVSLEIYDLTGKLIKVVPSNTALHQQYNIDLSNYPNGIYLAKLILDRQVVTKKITKV